MEGLGPSTVRLTIPSNPKFLGLVRDLVSGVSSQMRFPRSLVRKLSLAVDEACTNVIKHAYQGDWTKQIVVSCTIYDDRLEVLIRDFGKKATPEAFEPRRLEEVRPGGLGTFFIRKIMDEVTYDTSPPVGTELRLVKYKPGVAR